MDLTAIKSDDNVLKPRPQLAAWSILSPLFFWLLIFVVIPTALLVVASFCDRDGLGRIVYHSNTENYLRAIKSPYPEIVGRSVYFATITTVICLLVGYPVGYFIGRSTEKMRNILMMLVMVPFWTSFLIRTYAWISILAQDGLLNGFLLWANITSQPLHMLYTPGAVVLGLVYNYLPFMILPIYGSAEKLDNALVEAAYDLGAGPVRAFSNIIIPLTKPGIVAGIMLVFIPSLGMFAISGLMGGGSQQMIGDVIYKQFSGANNPPFGAALGTLLLIIFAIGLWFSNRKQVQ